MTSTVAAHPAPPFRPTLCLRTGPVLSEVLAARRAVTAESKGYFLVMTTEPLWLRTSRMALASP